MKFRLPFSFEHYLVTAIVDQSNDTDDRLSRGQQAWDLIQSGGDVLVRVKVRGANDDCVLHFDNGSYVGFDSGKGRSEEDCPERRRFLEACRARMNGFDSEGAERVRLAGAARLVVRQLLSEAS